MVNKKGRAGTGFENRIKDKCEQDGYWVIRAAGSKGVADLVLIPQKRKDKVCLMQCKYSSYHKKNPQISNLEIAELERECSLMKIPVVGLVVFNSNRKYYRVNIYP